MELADHERHLIGLLCWACRAATGPCNARRRQCPRRRKRSYGRKRTRRELLEASCLGATAHHAGRFARCHRRTAYRAYMHPRLTPGEMTAEEERPLLGEPGPDESYFVRQALQARTYPRPLALKKA